MFCRHLYQYTQGYFVCVKCRKRVRQQRTYYRKSKKRVGIILVVIAVAVIGLFLFYPSINPSYVTIQTPNFIKIPESPVPKIIKIPIPQLPLSKSIHLPNLSMSNLTSIIPEATPPPSLDELKQIALDDINKYRTQNGVHALTLGTARSSQIYTEELLKEGCIHHVDSRLMRSGDQHVLAAVVEQEPAAAPGPVHGEQDRHVGAPLDSVPGGARGQLDIGDAAVGRVERIDREVKTSFQLLVGPDLHARAAECRALRQWAPQRHLEARHRHEFGLMREW